MNRFALVVVGLVALAIGGLFAVNLWQKQTRQQPVKTDSNLARVVSPPAPEIPKKDPPPDGYVDVGGVLRPKTDVAPGKEQDLTVLEKSVGLDAGRVPAVDKNSNPSTRSVAEALAKPELSYRLTAMLPSPGFDQAAYDKDPQAYLDTIEPGRIYQFLQPGPGVAPLKREGKFSYQVLQGEKVVLRAKAQPGAPVTFYNGGKLGQFSNQLGVITVAADENGVAQAEFLASSGTRDEIDLVAASPLHSGQVRFVVQVVLPGQN